MKTGERERPHRGWFITFEGGEGTGKSTQVEKLAEILREEGNQVRITREPGGSQGAEAVRHVLLSGAAESLGAEMEAILFAAARSDHVEQIIRPALERGEIVICDRFFDSTRVYQGQTGGVDPDLLSRLEEIACEDCWPDITVILDLDPQEGLRRAAERRTTETPPDRFEKEALQQQQARRQAFVDIARSDPERCILIDASGTPNTVHKRIAAAVRKRMNRIQPGWYRSDSIGEEV